MRKHLWSTLALVVMVFLALGSINSDKTSKTGQTAPDAGAEPGRHIPGLAAVDVYGNFTDRGFKLEKLSNDEGTLWTCVEEDASARMSVEALGESASRITSVRATYLDHVGGDTNRAAREFLGYAASLPYDGSEPKRARAWVEANVGKNAKTTIGGVTFELFGNAPRARILVMEPAR